MEIPPGGFSEAGRSGSDCERRERKEVKTGLLSGILMLLGLIIGCSRHALYTEDDVRKFVLPGTSREAIIKHFGEPIVDEKNPKFEDGSTNIDEILNFSLPTESPPPQIGF